MVLHKPGATYVEEACRTLEYAYQHFYQVFAQAGFDLSRPSERLIWICFPQKSGFSKYALRVEGMDLSWLDGYYSTLTNRVAIVQPDQKMRQPEEVTPPSARDVHVAVAAHRSPQEGVLAHAGRGTAVRRHATDPRGRTPTIVQQRHSKTGRHVPAVGLRGIGHEFRI